MWADVLGPIVSSKVTAKDKKRKNNYSGFLVVYESFCMTKTELLLMSLILSESRSFWNRG